MQENQREGPASGPESSGPRGPRLPPTRALLKARFREWGLGASLCVSKAPVAGSL